jgi:hypothetical protein
MVKRNYAASGSIYAYPDPALDTLFQHQGMARETGSRLHWIQRLMHERVRLAPIMESASPHVVGPRVVEPAIGITWLTYFPTPYEEILMKE